MASATESFCSRNQPFGFFPSKVRPKVAPRWAFQLHLALAGITIFSRCGGSRWGVDRRGWSHQAARGIEPPGFRDSQRLVVGYGNYWGGSVPTASCPPLAAHCSLLSSMLSQVADGCAGTCIVIGVPAHRWLVERFRLLEFDYADMTRRCALLSRMEATPLRMFSQPCSWHSRKRS